jgi:hypothetical protein
MMMSYYDDIKDINEGDWVECTYLDSHPFYGVLEEKKDETEFYGRTVLSVVISGCGHINDELDGPGGFILRKISRPAIDYLS